MVISVLSAVLIALLWQRPGRLIQELGLLQGFTFLGMFLSGLSLSLQINILFRVLIFAVLLHGGALLAALLYSKAGRLDPFDLPPLLFCSTQKTLTTSALIWSAYFSEFLQAPIVLIVYYLTQLCIDALISGRIAIQKEANQ